MSIRLRYLADASSSSSGGAVAKATKAFTGGMSRVEDGLASAAEGLMKGASKSKQSLSALGKL